MPLSSGNSSHNTSPDDQLESSSSSLSTSKQLDGISSSASNIDQNIDPKSNKDALIAAQTAAATGAQPIRKRRVGKACDCCRIKKTKCDGKKPCSKCVMDNKVCIYTERKKSKDKVYSNDYVELIEKRLNLVGKALENLCELVKLDSNFEELQKFKSSLHINDVDEERISLNEAITLLVDESEIIETQPQVADLVSNGLIQQIIDDTRFEPDTPGFNTKIKQEEEEEVPLPSSISLGSQQMANGYIGNNGATAATIAKAI
ncbi:unnamed protein product [[Candida] boidinii]|nr:unnamed protein product [[Candida] boidinii]